MDAMQSFSGVSHLLLVVLLKLVPAQVIQHIYKHSFFFLLCCNLQAKFQVFLVPFISEMFELVIYQSDI